jgi:3-phytase
VGAYPDGLIVMQDDRDMDGEAHVAGVRRQNFKLVGWREVKAALGIE